MNPTSVPPFGPNPVDGRLVYAWPTRRVMLAVDAPTVNGIYVDPDAVDPTEPGLADRIGRDLAAAAGVAVPGEDVAIADFRPGRVNAPAAAGESPPPKAAQGAPDAPGSTNAAPATNDTAAPAPAAQAPAKGRGTP